MRTTTVRRPRCHGDVPRLLVAVAARTVLWTVLLLAAWSTVPAAFGWHVTTVASGSMSPAIRVGDVVAAMPVPTGTVSEGHVLLVDDPDRPDRLRLHRVERVLPDGAFRLRGDANAAADRSPVEPTAVRGVGVLRFPLVGLPGTWIRQGDWLLLAGAAVAMGLVGLLARADRRIRSGAPCAGCGTPRWEPGDTVVDTRPVPLPLVGVSAVVVAVALVAGTGADAAFTGGTTTAAALSTSTSFPCFAAPVDGAVLAWDFDEKTGPTVTDRTGNGHDAVMTANATRSDGSCSDDPALTLGDTGDSPRVLATTRVAGPTTFSTEVWFRTDRRQGSVMSFGSEHAPASAAKDRRLYVGASGRLYFGVQGSSGFAFATGSTSDVADGAWHHAVGTSRPGRMELWVDGTLQGARTDNTSPRQYEGHWRVGRESVSGWPDTGEAAFVGQIDTVRVHDRVLDAATIRAHAAAGR